MQLAIRLKETAPYGACPKCKKHWVDLINVGRNYWATCPRHNFCWCIGSDVFPDWREESEADWEWNEEFLKGMRVVRPSNWAYQDYSISEISRKVLWRLRRRISLRNRNYDLGPYLTDDLPF